MLCSVQTSKSSSNWLDRLWSNRGFNNNNNDDPPVPNPSSSPTTNASNSVINSNSESTHSDSDQIKVTATTATETTRDISSSDNKDLFLIMNNVLSDLFNMGCVSDPVEESSRLSRKKEKVPRKQTKPKFCFISGNNRSLNSDKNSNNVDCGVDDDDDEEDVDEEKGFGVSGDKELKGYSRSEVTVIDTSCQVWKFDKLVFRKKNVWKVRDKKEKSWVFGGKKRKGNDLESANGNGAKKKAKVSNLEVGSSKDVNDVEYSDLILQAMLWLYFSHLAWTEFSPTVWNMPNDGLKGEALISLQVMTGKVPFFKITREIYKEWLICPNPLHLSTMPPAADAL
ncbi:hypothetical protein DKX38_008149 [Salix brachista]|uniref:Uncharacterized protein n=1 Tax=Salix brachista TaxID=2182728 RepID=A0A5N5MPZ6_9ROSI|nr:hypothetical protein DKX38_008149 [Salix brachista]